LLAVAMAGIQLAACKGSSDSGSDPGPQVVPIRRLTNDEYVASTNDLFPGYTLPSVTFINDTKVLNFVNISSSQVGSRVRMEQYEGAAQAIAQAVTADPTALTGCDASAMGELACAQPYLFDLARRAYRRPVTDDEKTALWALEQNPDGGDYQTRLGMAVEGVLLSPKFIFRPEIGDPAHVPAPGVLALTPWEIATRLSYFLKGSLPDAELAASADSGKLASVDEIRAQAQRLLGDTATQQNLAHFHELWLGTDTISAQTRPAFPSFTPGLAVAMGHETRAFVQNVMFAQQGTFSDLMLSSYSFGDSQIAAFYGVPAPANDWDRIELDPTQRSGLLTMPSVLAVHAKDPSDNGGTPVGTPVQRGKFVLQQILCRTVQPPTADVMAMFPMQDYTLTARQASEAHRVSAICAGCHDQLDPLGLPFEHYDATGAWRDTDRGMPIDATGSLTDANGNAIAFDGVPALAKLVTQMPETRSCYTQFWYQFITGKLVADADQPYIQWLAQNFSSDKKLVDLVVDMVSTNSFRQLRSAQ
jgi:hypothetical protein